MGGGISTEHEWLEPDGLGGFASGTAGLVRTRRYHALLLVATRSPLARMVLVNGLEAHLTTAAGRYALSAQRYAPHVTDPDGQRWLEGFQREPWPRYTFRLPDDTRIEFEIFAVHGEPLVAVTFRRIGGLGAASLEVRPLLSGRDFHALHHENSAFDFEPVRRGAAVRFAPYRGVPPIAIASNGAYGHCPDWYRRFTYDEEDARGLDHVEDLAAPGVFTFDLARTEAVLLFEAEGLGGRPSRLDGEPERLVADLREAERTRRAGFPSSLHRAADAYLVPRGGGQTILAGYPWFADWGRDTFIAVRGLCLATGRVDDAERVLREWSRVLVDGLVPNCWSEDGGTPLSNAVDASLWYIVAVHALLRARAAGRRALDGSDLGLFRETVNSILETFLRGTRYGIRVDRDGLLAAGEPGVQLTWMDAKVDGRVATPRIGKPVEVQALWINALRVAQSFSSRHGALCARACASFGDRFWDEGLGHLHDVVDVDHRPGAVDSSFRPNQIFAVGGLPFQVLEGARAERVVREVERRLLTPVGLRTLAPDDPAYAGRYTGDARARDAAYHQGTVWPWLMGPFVEAWVRVQGETPEAKRRARSRFLAPLLAGTGSAGLGHLFEIADGDPPFRPRGCPFQAWSLGEALRLSLDVLRVDDPAEAERPTGGRTED